jgi:hypothetical protein
VWVGVRTAWPLLLPLLGYFVVRVQTSAWWPREAPDYYRFTTDPSSVVANAMHYLDRGGTVFLLTAIVLLLVTRSVPRFTPRDRHNLLRGAVWLAGGYALTLWVPVRSSLYAVFPSVGSALMLAVFAERALAQVDARRQLRAAALLVALPFVLWPVYRARNVRWVELADLTRTILPQVEPYVPALRAGARLWIRDDDSTRANVRNAFGGQMNNALQMRYGIDPLVEVIGGNAAPPGDGVVLRYLDGRLQNSGSNR